MKRIFPLVISLILFASAASPSLAHHKGRVLGASTPSSEVNFPPVTNGPGFILPDSPFYFLDKIKQDVRLLVAFTPEGKAKIHQNIAGERMAELRIMFARNNQNGINKTLLELRNEVTASAKELTNAELGGRNVGEAAKEINESIKTQRDVLSALEKQTNGTLQTQVGMAKMSIRQAKIEVEDALPADLIDKEIEESIQHELDDKIDSAKDNTDDISRLLGELNTQASDAAKNSLKNREEALKKAIEANNEELKQKQESLLALEKKKQEKYLELQKKATEQAKKETEKMREATAKLQESQNEIEEISNSTRELDKSMLELNSNADISAMLTPSPIQFQTKQVEIVNPKN